MEPDQEDSLFQHFNFWSDEFNWFASKLDLWIWTEFTGLYMDSACTQYLDFDNLTDDEINALNGCTIYCGWRKGEVSI